MRILYIIFLFAFACNQPEKKSERKIEREATSASASTNDSFTFKTFSENDSWGYDIYRNNELYVHQPNIPAVAGNKGFKTEQQAASVAQLAIEKLKQNISPPTISVEELDSLKAVE
jgi:hypothetical protein